MVNPSGCVCDGASGDSKGKLTSEVGYRKALLEKDEVVILELTTEDAKRNAFFAASTRSRRWVLRRRKSKKPAAARYELLLDRWEILHAANEGMTDDQWGGRKEWNDRSTTTKLQNSYRERQLNNFDFWCFIMQLKGGMKAIAKGGCDVPNLGHLHQRGRQAVTLSKQETNIFVKLWNKK